VNLTYDLFEKTPNGELLWHGAVCGLKAVRKELTELARRTGNECVLLDLQTHQIRRTPSRQEPKFSKGRSRRCAGYCRPSCRNANSHQIATVDALKDELNRTQIDLIFADLELAFTFAASAAASENPDTRNCNRAHALKAYFHIRDKLLPLCTPNDSQRAEIERKLAELQRCLERLSEKSA